MSLSAKTKKWLSENCLPSLKGKRVLITGANSGVGFKAAETMVYLGAALIMACRSAQKAAAAREALLREYPGADITFMELDLASFDSIDRFAARFREQRIDVDAFVNNAGAFRHPGQKTADGLDLVFGTNYVGVYRLSERLLPWLTGLGHDVWYVNTISFVHRYAKVAETDSAFARPGGSLQTYARSKLCLARYTWFTAQRYMETNVHALMCHPGIAVTPLGLNAFGLNGSNPLISALCHLFNSPEKSSLSLAYILSGKAPAGSLVGPAGGFGGWGWPRLNRVSRKVQSGGPQLVCLTESLMRSAEEGRG
ncbi:MAG: SDR family NAD(P)-dependent oxidoreductase [Clostridia bacterium]|nr:SDR family NAD(P)-dependent oxidoreductase [Clostridia bacterium]